MNAVQRQLKTFFSQYPEEQFHKKEIIVSASVIASNVYYLVQGQVKQYSTNPDGREFLVNIYKPGTFFPMVTALTDAPNNYYFEAMGKVRVYKAPVLDTVNFLRTNGEVMFDLLKRLYLGMDGLIKLITQSMTGSVNTKVVSALLMLLNRFGEREGNKGKIVQLFTHNEIAKIVGISRESVTRALSELKENGLIEVKGRSLYFPNLKKLEEELS